MRNRGAFLLVALLGAAGAALAGENIDPAADGHQYAWGENVGWINAEPSDDGGNGVEVTDFALRGFMWGENIGWISLSCDNTGVCGTTPFGIVNEGSGQLSGYAWSENSGWINFAPTTCLQDPTCGVKIDPATGYFSGRAWGENVGWVTLSPGAPETWTTRTSWCQGTPAAPGPVAGLALAKQSGEVSLSWSVPAGAAWFDVVAGSLGVLRSSQGNFGLATATCVANRIATSSVAAPAQGNAVWFLVRAANCRGRGTYETGSPSQHGGRDAGIASSRFACP